MSSRNVTLDEVQRVINECDDPWRRLFWLLLETGGRYMEIASLTFKQIGVDSIKIEPHLLPSGRMWRPKRPASVRSVVMSSDACWALQSLRKEHPDDALVFWPGRAEPVQSRTANYILKTRCQRLGIEPFSTHHCRRVRITQALEAGANPNTVRAAVGHRSLITTVRYMEGVPVRGELPSVDARKADAPVVNDYMFLARTKNWSR